MKICRFRLFFFLSVFLCLPVIFRGGRGSAEETESKIGGFRFYITDDNGKQKGVVNGFKADFLSPNEIEITDASARITDIGKIPILIQTSSCIFIKDKSHIVSDRPVVIKTEAQGVEINGIGLEWSLEKKILIIKKDVIVDVLKSLSKKQDDDE